MADVNHKQKFIHTLQNAVDAENMLHFCYSQLSKLIKNGAVKQRMLTLATVANDNKELLIRRLVELGVSQFVPEHKCKFCDVKAESFSLLGEINLGIEAIGIEIRLYKELSDLAEREEDINLFHSLLKEKKAQRLFLENERKYAEKYESECKGRIDTICIPDIISRFWE